MIDLNSADRKKLIEVRGIGPVTAERIISYREQNNGFTELDELKNIKGIGDATFSDIRSGFELSSDKVSETEKTEGVEIEFDPDQVGIEQPSEVHLVGDMNEWNPADKTYSLKKDSDGVWRNEFELDPGTEYKIMYDSTDWDEDKHIGFYGENFKVEEQK